jgi:cytochrome c peroxidase
MTVDPDHDDHKPAAVLSVDFPRRRDPTTFAAVRGARRDYCHVPKVEFPFCADFAITRAPISQGVAQGLRHFEFAPLIDAQLASR